MRAIERAATVVLIAAAACGGARPGAVRSDEAIVYVTSNVSDAQVYVDGRFIGSLGMVRGGLAMDPGSHRLELRRDDYFSRYAEVAVTRAQHTKLDLEMRPILP